LERDDINITHYDEGAFPYHSNGSQIWHLTYKVAKCGQFDDLKGTRKPADPQITRDPSL
jgi:hypothetical protein